MWPDTGGGLACLFGTDPRRGLGRGMEGGVTVIDEHSVGLTAGQGLADSQTSGPRWDSSGLSNPSWGPGLQAGLHTMEASSRRDGGGSLSSKSLL